MKCVQFDDSCAVMQYIRIRTHAYIYVDYHARAAPGTGNEANCRDNNNIILGLRRRSIAAKMAMIRCALAALLLAAILPFGISFSQCEDSATGTDMTLVSREYGKAVVLSTIKKVEDSMIFPDIFNLDFLRRMAAVESEDGTRAPPGSGGIWGIKMMVFNNVGMFIRGNLGGGGRGFSLAQQFEREFCFNWYNEVNGIDALDTPLYSALVVMIRLKLADVDVKELNDITEQANVWKSIFNSDGDIGKFIKISESLTEDGKYITCTCF